MAALLDRWAGALTGPRRHAAIGYTLAAYGLIWTVYRQVSTLPRDIHFDMSELYAWSRTLAFGYEKHPPLSALVVRVWFAVFPVDDVAFTLLAALNIVLTLYVVWLILERWTDPVKSAFGVALLMLVPFYNFQSLKYNANTVLLPVWSFTAYAFLRAFETRNALWSVVAGLAAGAAMLGKYWSVFLVAGFVLAALIDPRKRMFFSSAAPYLMVLAGALVVAPHVHWLMAGNGGGPFGYAEQRLEGNHSIVPTLSYFAGTIGYAVLPVAMWALLVRPNARTVQDVADPTDPQRTLALLCFMLPNVLPLLASPWLAALTPLWALPGYSLLPLVLLASPMVLVGRRALRQMIAIAAVTSIGALLASPLIALAIHMRAQARPTDYGSLLARDVAARWEAITPARLRYIFGCGGDADPAQAVAFDLKLPTRTLSGRQGMGARSDLLARGGVIVSAASDANCKDQGEMASRMRPGTERFAATYQPSLFGFVGQPFSYVAYIVPPP